MISMFEVLASRFEFAIGSREFGQDLHQVLVGSFHPAAIGLQGAVHGDASDRRSDVGTIDRSAQQPDRPPLVIVPANPQDHVQGCLIVGPGLDDWMEQGEILGVNPLEELVEMTEIAMLLDAGDASKARIQPGGAVIQSPGPGAGFGSGE